MGEKKMMKLRYFAIVYYSRKGSFGYVLDYYPEERLAYQRENRKHIIGDFASSQEATEAIKGALKARYAKVEEVENE